jgi:hypothetical protein
MSISTGVHADNVAPPVIAPRTPRRKKSKALGPQAFAQQVVDALLPLADGEELRDGVGRKDIYLAVVPFFAEFTIADAVASHAMFTAVRDSTPYGTGDRYTAAFTILEILEDFICAAFPSGPECVAAMAHFATLTMDGTDDPVVWPDGFRSLLKQICTGIGHLRSGSRFTMGERFGVPAGTSLAASWVGRCCGFKEFAALREPEE